MVCVPLLTHIMLSSFKGYAKRNMQVDMFWMLAGFGLTYFFLRSLVLPYVFNTVYLKDTSKCLETPTRRHHHLNGSFV